MLLSETTFSILKSPPSLKIAVWVYVVINGHDFWKVLLRQHDKFGNKIDARQVGFLTTLKIGGKMGNKNSSV